MAQAMGVFDAAPNTAPKHTAAVIASPPVGYDGPGPNPLLQNHPLMAFHPPMLYLGYISIAIPFAFAVAALIEGRVDAAWAR